MSGELGWQLVSQMEEITWNRHGEMALANIRRNNALLDRGRSIRALCDEQVGETGDAIIIAAGPSLKRQDPAPVLRESQFKGAVISTESSLYYCLRNGIVPDLTVTIDPHATRVVRWFGDPSLTEDAIANDDYYRRQDMDEAFADELRANREILDLLNEHGSRIRIALCTSASAAVVDRVLETGMDVYWWNPMLDDPDAADSITARMQTENGLPCINAGGNVGTAAWMLADVVLRKHRVALTGVDFSYYDGTPYRSTQYYNEAVDLVGESGLDDLFIRVFNPHTQRWFFTDPAYMWYREAFLEMVADADCQTFNCTEGGILFGDGVNFLPLREFLEPGSGSSDAERTSKENGLG